MLSNLHSHTIFCDGKNTPEEMANAAIKKGFDSFGISGHGYTDFDLSYCIKDTDGYINAVQGLKKRLKGKFQLYLGVEEDAFAPVKNRSAYDYIIGSCHYIFAAGSYMPVDSGLDGFKKCLDFFDGDAAAMAESYYSAFCGYIEKRKPDIIGHFDLITKYDEVSGTGMLDNSRYNEVAEKYLKAALKTEALFEVNTGAVFRKYRISPYPCERLLRVILKEGGRVILSSDAHSIYAIDYGFAEARKLLRDIGFTHTYVLYNNEFVKDYIK